MVNDIWKSISRNVECYSFLRENQQMVKDIWTSISRHVECYSFLRENLQIVKDIWKSIPRKLECYSFLRENGQIAKDTWQKPQPRPHRDLSRDGSRESSRDGSRRTSLCGRILPFLPPLEPFSETLLGKKASNASPGEKNTMCKRRTQQLHRPHAKRGAAQGQIAKVAHGAREANIPGSD